MTRYLLDVNVLIALTVAEHQHHHAASSWAATMAQFALCPVVEGALVRFLVRTGEGIATASAVLRSIHARPGYAFWPDGLSYGEADLGRVRGHRQVTDAYLARSPTPRPAHPPCARGGGAAAGWVSGVR